MEYPLDGSGKASSNRIGKEEITLRPGLNRATTVSAGAFYLKGLFLEDASGKSYKYGTDFYVAVPAEIAKSLLQSEDTPGYVLVITNQSIPNKVFVTYQTPGGKFNVPPTALVDAYYASGLVNHPFGAIAAFGDVTTYPASFWKSTELLGDISKNIGFEHVVSAYNRVSEILNSGDAYAIDRAIQLMKTTMVAHLALPDPHPQYKLANGFKNISAILKPSNLSPANGSSTVRLGESLVGNTYRSLYGIEQIGAYFEVCTNPNFVSGVLQSGYVLGTSNRFALKPGLIPGLNYYWRVRYAGEENELSEWSEPTSFSIADGAVGVRKTVYLTGAGTFNLPADVADFVISGRGSAGTTVITPEVPPHSEIWQEGAVIVNPALGQPKLVCSIGTGVAINTGALIETKNGKLPSATFGMDFEMPNGERVRAKFEMLYSLPSGSWVNGAYQYDVNGVWLLRCNRIVSITRVNGDILQDVGTSNLLDSGSVIWRNIPIMTDPGGGGSPMVVRKFIGQSTTVAMSGFNTAFAAGIGGVEPATSDVQLHVAQHGNSIAYVVPTGGFLSVTMMTSS